MRGRDLGLPPNRTYSLRRNGACCAECGAPWFKQGQHYSDCRLRPRRLNLNFVVRVAI